MQNQKTKSKKIVWMVLIIVIAIIAITLYEMIKFKPLPASRDEGGNILSSPENGFLHYKETPQKY